MGVGTVAASASCREPRVQVSIEAGGEPGAPGPRQSCTSSPNSSPRTRGYLRFVARSVLKLGRAAYGLPPLVDHLPVGPAGPRGAAEHKKGAGCAGCAVRARGPFGAGDHGRPGSGCRQQGCV